MTSDAEVCFVAGVHLRMLREIAARLDQHGVHSEGRAILDVVETITHAKRGVSTGSAARMLGVTPQTIRNWVRGGVLAGWYDNTGHVLVARDALEPAIAMRSALPMTDVPIVADEEIDAEIAAMRAERRRSSAAAR